MLLSLHAQAIKFYTINISFNVAIYSKNTHFMDGGYRLPFFSRLLSVYFWYLGRKGRLQRKDELIGGRFLAPNVDYVNKLLKKKWGSSQP